MPEKGFKPALSEDKNSWGKMTHVFVTGLKTVKKSPVLIAILAIASLYGLSSEGFDRLWSMHFLKDMSFPEIGHMTTVEWFGIINTVSMVLSIITVEIIKRKLEKSGKLAMVWMLFGINVLTIVRVVIFGLAGEFKLALITFWSSSVLRKVNSPVYSAWINQNITSNVRATIISTSGQMDSFGQILGGPLAGLIALKLSVSSAIVSAALIMSPIVFLYLYALKKSASHSVNAEVGE
jgi:DHA3 family tetracycline resistance protein-like MFS transporter